MKKKIIIIVLAIILIIGVFLIENHNTMNSNKNLTDIATSSDHNDIWKTSNSIISREKNGTLITRGENESWFYLYLNPSGTGSNYIYSVPFTLEFDIINNTYRSQIEFRDSNDKFSNFEFNSLPDRGVGHWKIIINSNNQSYYKDGKLVKTDNQPLKEKIRIGFVGVYNKNQGNSTIKFANFKIYE